MSARDRQVNFRVSDEEHEAIERAAEEAGMTVSEWLRIVALTASGQSALSRQLRRLRT